MSPSAGDSSISCSIGTLRRRADSTSEPYSTKVPAIANVLDVFARRALSRRAPPCHRFRPVLIETARAAIQHFLQIGADVVGIDRLLLARAATEVGLFFDEHQRMVLEHGVAGGDGKRAHDAAVLALTACCIFIASSTSTS